MIRCTECDREADYIRDGNSLCSFCYGKPEPKYYYQGRRQRVMIGSDDVLDFITAHPGVYKQEIVDYFKGRAARVPIFNMIKDMVNKGIIKAEGNGRAGIPHRLYVS